MIGQRTIRVTNPGRQVFPADAVVKTEVMAYYVQIADRLLPHLRRRPVTRIRWPGGVTEGRFFEKQIPRGSPDWIETLTVRHSDGEVTYPLAHEAATLAWFAQQNALELHVPQWRWFGDQVRIDRLVLDLDPGPGVELLQCAEVALWLKDRLDAAGIVNVPVTSGSKGIHIYGRWRASQHDTSTSDYAKDLADAAQSAFPQLVTSNMFKSDRQGKVLIDWSQNNPAKTTITPYSLRGRSHPFVAAPREWDELGNPELRHLLMPEVLTRLKHPDPLAVLL